MKENNGSRRIGPKRLFIWNLLICILFICLLFAIGLKLASQQKKGSLDKASYVMAAGEEERMLEAVRQDTAKSSNSRAFYVIIIFGIMILFRGYVRILFSGLSDALHVRKEKRGLKK